MHSYTVRQITVQVYPPKRHLQYSTPHRCDFLNKIIQKPSRSKGKYHYIFPLSKHVTWLAITFSFALSIFFLVHIYVIKSNKMQYLTFNRLKNQKGAWSRKLRVCEYLYTLNIVNYIKTCHYPWPQNNVDIGVISSVLIKTLLQNFNFFLVTLHQSVFYSLECISHFHLPSAQPSSSSWHFLMSPGLPTSSGSHVVLADYHTRVRPFQLFSCKIWYIFLKTKPEDAQRRASDLFSAEVQTRTCLTTL